MNPRYARVAIAIFDKHCPPEPAPKPIPQPAADAPRDAKGRVLPIRAYGESEVRPLPLSPRMPQPMVQNLLLNGSHHQRVAIKRALILAAKNFYLLKSLYFMEGALPYVYYTSELEAVQGRNEQSKYRKKQERRVFREAFRTGTPLPKHRTPRTHPAMYHINPNLLRQTIEERNTMHEDTGTHRKMVDDLIKRGDV